MSTQSRKQIGNAKQVIAEAFALPSSTEAMALHDRAFLEKIEQFLLHPTVRALSLAQRVDFLEQKVVIQQQQRTIRPWPNTLACLMETRGCPRRRSRSA